MGSNPTGDTIQCMSVYWFLISAVLWSVGSIINKAALKCMPPLEVFVAELIISIALLPFLMVWFKLTNTSLTFHPRGWVLAGIATLLALAAGCLADFVVAKNDVSTISVIMSIAPGLTCLLAWIFLGEQMTSSKIVGIGLAIIAIYLVGR